MNKKVSTLLTVALTLGGSLLSSSAFAETLPIGKKVNDTDNKFVSGGTYFIVQDANQTINDSYGVLGQDWADNDDYKEENFKIIATNVGNSALTKEDIKKYLWTIKSSTVQGKGTVYTFYNQYTKKYLAVKSDASGNYTFQTVSTAADAENEATTFAMGKDFVTYNGVGKYLSVSSTLMDNDETNDKALTLANYNPMIVARTAATDPKPAEINFYSVSDEEVETPEAGELNDLYNRAGFNFKIEEGVANIFGEGKVKAIHVVNDVVEDGVYKFPQGTYFATETPVGSYPSNGSEADKLEYLKGCTFIAVDPDNNVSDDKDLQAAGQGFTLTTVAAKDLNLYTETRPGAVDSNLETKGSQISVFNACFKGWHNATKPGQYALALGWVRYQKEAGKDAHEAKALAINVIKVHYGSTKYLATDANAINYVFTLESSSAVNPADKEAGILKENAAAIYNIKFVSGDASDHQSEYGKYLTFVNAQPNADVTTTYKEWWAKGEAIADLNTPAYQFVISKVSGNDITFTNRETGDNFTAQLFEEEEGVYYLALSAITNNASNVADATYCVADVKDNGDVEKVNEIFKLNDALIKLVPVTEVDKYDGFLNVEDETIMTLAFARDFTPTSNKLYPVVDEDNKFPTAGTDVKLTDEVSDAVEFMLVKDGKPTYTTYNYYYLNDAGKAVVKNWGDTIAVQSYKMQLVNDGTPVSDKYIKINANNTVELGTATPVIVKNNPDGSVAIKTRKDATKYLSVANYNKTDGSFKETCAIQMAGVSSQPNATDVKTYLFNDSPVISWKAERGHVTLQTEMGNYITANEDNAGIVTSNEAETFYLHVADTKASVPSFFISKGKGENSNAESERMFLFNPADSVSYLVNAPVDPKYQWDEESNKAIFKSAKLNATADTLTTSIKGKETLVAQKADNKNVQGGLDKFKFQIIEAEEGGYYYIRQVGASKSYLRNLNGKLTWSDKKEAVMVAIKDTEAPTSNEGVSATEVKVVAQNGSVVVKNAAGKNVVVSTILGQVVANEVLTSDNATINVPAGIVVVAVEGESFKVNVK